MKEKRFKKVYIEIINACNLKCDFCPTLERPQTFMDHDLFDKIISQLEPLTNSVNLHVMGEPMQHPQVGLFIETCRRHSVPVTIVTNGTLLSRHYQDILLNPIVQQVNFSLQSFQANFPDADNTTFLRRIFEYTARAFAERPDQHVNYRLWNVSDYGKALIFNKELIDKMKAFFGIEDDTLTHISLRGRKVINSLHLNLATRFDWPSLELPFRTTEGTCPGLITQLGILSDGTVVPCCLDKEGVISLGNASQKPLEQIINSPRSKEIIRGFKCRELTEELCQHCTFISRFEKKVRWIKGHQRWTNHA